MSDLLTICFSALVEGSVVNETIRDLDEDLSRKTTVFLYSCIHSIIKARTFQGIQRFHLYLANKENGETLFLSPGSKFDSDPALVNHIPPNDMTQLLEENYEEAKRNTSTTFVVYGDKDYPLLLLAISRVVVSLAIHHHPGWSLNSVPKRIMTRIRLNVGDVGSER
jgi:hypothetical protein